MAVDPLDDQRDLTQYLFTGGSAYIQTTRTVDDDGPTLYLLAEGSRTQYELRSVKPAAAVRVASFSVTMRHRGVR